MKIKRLIFLLILTSLAGYLEWSGNSHVFLITAEMQIISALFTQPETIIHPFTILPLAGQLLLFICLFQKKPYKSFIYLGVGCLGLLLGFMFIIGIISMNFKIIISTIPFLSISVLLIKELRTANQE